MAVIPGIMSGVKKFAGKPMGIASKALAIATTASVIYDMHINGRERAYSLDEIESADRYYNQYKQYMLQDTRSATTSKMKKLWFDFQQSFSYYHIISRVKGYLTGAGETIINSLPLIALSAIALKFKTAGKIAGTMLAASAVKTLLYDVMGINAEKKN